MLPINQLLAVACASITGISLGIALHHKQSLGTPSPMAQYSSTVMQPTGSQHYASTADNEHRPRTMYAPHTGSSTHLESKLSKLLEQQETMGIQQSELNRELNAIQFRLDTHSASFRPLQSERDTKILNSPLSSGPLTPLLPPRQ